MKLFQPMAAPLGFLRRPNIWVLLIGACCLAMWQMAQALLGLFPQLPRPLVLLANLLSGLAGFLALLAAPGILLRLVASGPGAVLDWRFLSDVPGRMLKPALRSGLAILWSFLPAGMYLGLLGEGRPSPWALAALAGLGMAYLPMALMMTASSSRLLPSLLPSGVLEQIFRQPIGYVRLLASFWPMTLLPLAGLLWWGVPLIGPLVSSFLLLWLWCGGAALLAEFRNRWLPGPREAEPGPL